jgi:hypothetical protein
MWTLQNRLAEVRSPVTRAGIMLQMAQLMDVVKIGDTTSDFEIKRMNEIDELVNKLTELGYYDSDDEKTD